MPVLSPNDPRLGPDFPFITPFPSSEAQSNKQFQALTKTVESLPNASPSGMMAAAQAEAWTSANRVLMRTRFTAKEAGGLRSDWEDAVIGPTGNGFDQLVGMFANVSYPNKTDKKAMRDAAIDAGLTIAQNLVSAVPIVGNILGAAIGFGKMIWKLLSGGKEVVVIKVPWAEYSEETDQDFVNLILKPWMKSTDWTAIFAPALSWSSGFRIMETKKGGETRAWGTWTGDGEPLFGSGIGFMPGTERITQVMQIANVSKGPTHRLDSVTDVGSFLPSTAQWGTGAWEMVLRGGNPDMYKVRAGDLANEWENYFDRMFADAWDRWDKGSDLTRLFMAKALMEFIYVSNADVADQPDTFSGLSHEEFAKPFINPDIFDPNKFKSPYNPDAVFRPMHDLWLLPALRTLKQRQKSMLARSLVCAMVRYKEVAGMPPFAAFQDKSAPLSPGYSTFGEELVDYCKEMREILLTHPARHDLAQPKPDSPFFQVWAPDVRDVDPAYADKLEATLIGGLPLKANMPFGISATPLEPDAPKPDPAGAPGGGPPFPPGEDDGTMKWLLPLLAAGSVIGGIGGALYLQETAR